MQEKDKITTAHQECFRGVLELHILFWLGEGKHNDKWHATPCLALLLYVHPSDSKEIIHFSVMVTSI